MPILRPQFSVWFDVPSDPYGGRVLIKHLNDGDKNEIIKKALKTKLVVNSEGKPELLSSVDTTIDRELTTLACIQDWENFFDGRPTPEHLNGTPMKCTMTNKLLFVREDGFSDMILGMRAECEQAFLEVNKGAEKN